MIQFVEPSKPFKPFQLRFWNRTFGSEFPSFEFSRMMEFYDAKKMNRPNISGYVKRIDDRHFLLLPTLYTPFPLLCTCAEGISPPPENAYVNIEGQSRWTKLQKIVEREFAGEKEIVVEKWTHDFPKWLNQVKPNISFRDFKEETFTRIVDIEPLVQDFLACQIISCPSFDGFVGGLNVCTFDATKKALARKIIKEIREVVPRDIGKAYNISTPFGKVQLRYNYRFVPINADKPLLGNVVSAMVNRTARFRYDEISFCLGSKKNAPKTLDEPPCRLSDFPIILNEEVNIAKKKVDPSLEAFKYMHIQHFITPIISNTEDIISKVHDKLIKLQDSYGIPQNVLARFKILDASYYGKPQSMLRLALANARIDNRKKISNDHVNHAFKMFYKNFDNIYEVWSDLFTTAVIPLRAKMLLMLSPDERKIFKTVETLQSTRKKCVTIDEIASNLPKIKRYVLEQLLEDLSKKRGLLIEKLPQCYEPLSLAN